MSLQVSLRLVELMVLVSCVQVPHVVLESLQSGIDLSEIGPCIQGALWRGENSRLSYQGSGTNTQDKR